MILKTLSVAGAALLIGMSGAAAQADSIGEVENARAKDRAGYYTNRADREKLRRYGRNDDYGYGGGYGYSYDDDDRPYYGNSGVSVYVGPGGGYYDD